MQVGGDFFSNAFIIFGNDLDKFSDAAVPVRKYLAGDAAAGVFCVLQDHLLQLHDVVDFLQRLQQYDFFVAVAGKGSVFIENISNTAAHAGSKVAAGFAQNDDCAAGHIFTAMIANAFDNGVDAAVADTEAFTGNAGNIGFPAGGAVKSYVADNDVLVRVKSCFGKGVDDDLSA